MCTKPGQVMDRQSTGKRRKIDSQYIVETQSYNMMHMHANADRKTANTTKTGTQLFVNIFVFNFLFL